MALYLNESSSAKPRIVIEKTKPKIDTAMYESRINVNSSGNIVNNFMTPAIAPIPPNSQMAINIRNTPAADL